MIVQEPFTKDGRQLVRRYSDLRVYIYGGNPPANYESAVDPADAAVTYVETDIPIDNEEITDAEALAIITGQGGVEA